MRIHVVQSASEINVWTKAVGFDIETSPKRKFMRQGLKDIEPDPRLHNIVMAQIAVEDDVYILLDNFQSMKPLLSDPDVLKIFHNGAFEYKHMLTIGIEIRNFFDTMLVEGVLEAGRRPGLSLESACERRLGVKLNKKIRDRFIRGERIDQEMIEYGAMDAWVMPKLYRKLLAAMADYHGIDRVLRLEHQLLPAVAQLELDGILIDEKAWKTQAALVREKLKVERAALLAMLPIKKQRVDVLTGQVAAELNLNSRDRVLELMHEVGADVPNLKKDVVADYLEKHPHPVLEAYARYVKLNKADTTYGYTFLENVNPVTGRVHQHVGQLGARTGRLSGWAPNLMNIPKESAYRQAFIAKPGYLFTGADYSQQELRVLAEYSRDRGLIEAFEQGIDIHIHVARLLFRDKTIDGDKHPKRKAAKNLNFGLIYGMGVNKLARGLKISVREAKELMDLHAHTFPGAFEWKVASVAFAKEHGYVETLLGRRRYLDTSDQKYEREAGNTPIQGSSADMTKIAVVILYSKYDERPVNIVHDEIVLEAKKDRIEEARKHLESAMLEAAHTMVKHVPFACDSYISDRWGKN